MHSWSKDIAVWKMDKILCISVPFTWNIKEAVKLANKTKGKVLIGGPAIMLQREFVQSSIQNHVTIQDKIPGIEPVTIHNPFATFTTRGCISKCGFCAVPKIEGDFKEISDFIPRPIVCDNNFLAASNKHFNKAVDKLKSMPIVDFNQSLDATLFTPEKATRLQELKIPNMRFSFDNIKKENQVVDAIRLAKQKGFSKITVLILYGFCYTPEESAYMGEVLRKEKIMIFPMRYQPLDAKIKNQYVNKEKGWTNHSLSAFGTCFFSTRVEFDQYNKHASKIGEGGLFNL